MKGLIFFFQSLSFSRSIATPYRCVAKLKQVNDSTKIQMHQSVEAKLKVLRERYERETAYNEDGSANNGEINE
jgi:hypothetical protein